jgi:hypothetical protein
MLLGAYCVRTPMKPTALTLLLAAALMTPSQEAGAAATSDMLQKAFGNTIVSTFPDGRTALLWLKAGGEFSGKGRRRLLYSGVWTEKGDKLCLRQTRPIPIPFSYCAAIPAGTTWTGKAITGEPVKMQLLPGVVEVPATAP